MQKSTLLYCWVLYYLILPDLYWKSIFTSNQKVIPKHSFRAPISFFQTWNCLKPILNQPRYCTNDTENKSMVQDHELHPEWHIWYMFEFFAFYYSFLLVLMYYYEITFFQTWNCLKSIQTHKDIAKNDTEK